MDEIQERKATGLVLIAMAAGLLADIAIIRLPGFAGEFFVYFIIRLFLSPIILRLIKVTGGVNMKDLDQEESDQYVIFTIDEYKFGLPVNAIETVIRMVEITPIPGSPAFILGAINFHGQVIPVINLRHRLGMPIRPILINDQLIIIHTPECCFALTIDTVKDIMECNPAGITKADDILPHLPYLVGVAKFFDGMILLTDPRKIFNPAEIEQINNLINAVPI
jgi:purine-binding chemotaxis protein CheW